VAIHIQTTLGEEGIPYDQAAHDEEMRTADGKPKKEIDRSIFGNYVGKIRKLLSLR